MGECLADIPHLIVASHRFHRDIGPGKVVIVDNCRQLFKRQERVVKHAAQQEQYEPKQKQRIGDILFIVGQQFLIVETGVIDRHRPDRFLRIEIVQDIRRLDDIILPFDRVFP